MGTTLHAVVEAWYEASDSWDDVAQWEFNKDYTLMIALRNHPKCHEDWPKDMTTTAEELIEECYADTGRHWFHSNELPEVSEASDRYQAMRRGFEVMDRPVRVLFYTL